MLAWMDITPALGGWDPFRLLCLRMLCVFTCVHVCVHVEAGGQPLTSLPWNLPFIFETGLSKAWR